VYLAAIIDLFGRRVVGWDVNDTKLALSALNRAVSFRKPHPGIITHHSDRGSPYAPHEYLAALRRFGMRPSMSRKGGCGTMPSPSSA